MIWSNYDTRLAIPQLLTAAWVLLLGGYAAVAVCVPAGAGRTAFGDIFQCLLPLLVNGALLMNAITPNWRKNAFWMLLALGCSLGLGGQVIWTYVGVYQHRVLPDPFIGDFVFFLRALPMIAALTMQPHKQPDNRKMLYGYVDFSLLSCWWIYLYLISVIPWQSIAIDDVRYHQAYNVICTFENLVFVAGAIMLSARAAGRWRRIYTHLAGAGAAYSLGSLLVNLSIQRGVYSTGSLYDLRSSRRSSGWERPAWPPTAAAAKHLQARPGRRRRKPPEARSAAKPSGRRAWRERHCFRFHCSASGV